VVRSRCAKNLLLVNFCWLTFLPYIKLALTVALRMNLITIQLSAVVRSMSAAAVIFCLTAAPASALAGDPLPSWNDGAAKTAILDFLTAVTDKTGKDFVPQDDRIATFDNDGCLWVEKPFYTQLQFVRDRVIELAPQHPSWKTQQPFKALIEGDMKAVAASGEKGLMKALLATHSGMTADEFTTAATRWIQTAKHPRFKRLYIECVYVPQLELLQLLRNKGFRVFIVSGGGVEFMRPWAKKVYGVPPSQVVGSRVVTRFEMRDGKPVLVRQPEIKFIDDKAGKPVGIYEHIGQRPLLAFGNSDGDLQMIQYTTGGSGRRLGLFVHHTDARREYAYDRESHVGRLDKSLDLAEANGWVIVDMKRDWKRVFAFQK